MDRCCLTEPQDLNEQIAERVEIAVAEVTDAAVVLLLVTGPYPERQVLMGGTLELVGGDDAHAVGVE